MSSLTVNVQELALTIGNIQFSRLTSGAAATLALYDWFLVFGREFDTIYRSKWSLAKCLFMFVRLITPPGVIIGTIQLVDFRPALSKQCNENLVFLMIALLTSVCASHGLFTMRLIALYKSKKVMVWFIAIFYLATYIATYGITITAAIFLVSSETFYSDLLHICASLGTTQLAAPIWYAPAAFETFIFGLTAYRAWHDAKVISGPASAPLLVLFYRDGMIAFLVMTGMRVWNIWVCLTQPASNLYSGAMLMWATNTVLTTRVYMNLVWFIRAPNLTTCAFTGVEIEFVQPPRDTLLSQRREPADIEMRVPKDVQSELEWNLPETDDYDNYGKPSDERIPTGMPILHHR